MDSNKCSAQVERFEVVETGRRRRWTDDEKAQDRPGEFAGPPGRFIDSPAIRHLALAADLAAIVLGPGRAVMKSLGPALCRRW